MTSTSFEKRYLVEQFGCEVTDVTFNLMTCVGHVHMPEGNCTDMDSTIKFFQNFIPEISHIVTWSDGKLDTQYVDHAGDGKWIAI